MEKQFLLFAGDGEKKGGFHDFQNAYASLEEAKSDGNGWEWWHVADLETLEIIESKPTGGKF